MWARAGGRQSGPGDPGPRRDPAVGVTGYEAEVDWVESAAFEVLLLDRLSRGGRTDAIYRSLHREHGQLAARLGLVAATKSSVYRGGEKTG